MGGSSKSSASQQTNNTDKRQVNESGIAVSADNSSVSLNVQSLDAGIVGKALETVQIADATNADGFGKLLSLAEKLTTKSQDTATTMAARYTDDVLSGVKGVKDAEAGRLDQQTIVVLGLAGAAVAAVAMAKRGK